jgi:hypothetical protein
MITIALFWDRILEKDDEDSYNYISWILVILV